MLPVFNTVLELTQKLRDIFLYRFPRLLALSHHSLLTSNEAVRVQHGLLGSLLVLGSFLGLESYLYSRFVNLSL